MSDVTFIRYPYRDSLILREFLDAVAKAAGDPPRDSLSYYGGAAIHILPPELTQGEPRDVVQEL